MTLSAKTICIVGPRRFHNEVMADFIHSRLGAPCHLVSALDQDADAGDSLFLLDCLGVDRELLDQWLRQASALWANGRLLALFNLAKGLGMERAALDAGVRGLFFDDDSADTLVKGISVLFGGELWVARRILSDYLLTREIFSPSLPSTPPPPPLSPLTRREREVLTMLSHGASNDQIGCRMCISTNTVKTHLYNIFRKIRVSNRLEAALWTARHN
jgi:LuxR family transcriptional regulator of csgAB operon